MHPRPFSFSNSTVKLEIDATVLEEIFDLLANNNRLELIRRFLCQLRTEEYISDADLSHIADHYHLGSPLLW